jgi:hypothetical protein
MRVWLKAAEAEMLVAAGQDVAALNAMEKAATLLTPEPGEVLPYLALEEAHLTRWQGNVLARLGHKGATDQGAGIDGPRLSASDCGTALRPRTRPAAPDRRRRPVGTLVVVGGDAVLADGTVVTGDVVLPNSKASNDGSVRIDGDIVQDLGLAAFQRAFSIFNVVLAIGGALADARSWLSPSRPLRPAQQPRPRAPSGPIPAGSR